MRKLLLLSLLFLGLNVNAQIKRTAILEVENTSDYSDMSWLDTLAERYKIIMYGEDHRYVKANRNLEYKTLSYLAKKKKLVYITEFGKVSNWLLNKYVTENDSSLDRFFTLQCVNSFSQFYRELRDFKQNNPELELQIVGIDIQRQVNDVVKAYSILLNNKPTDSLSDSTKLVLATMNALNDLFDQYAMVSRKRPNGGYYLDNDIDTLSTNYYYDYDSLLFDRLGSSSYHRTYSSFLGLQQDLKNNREEIMKLAGKDSALLGSFMDEADKMIYWNTLRNRGDIKEAVYRETSMTDNFIKLYHQDTSALFFGMFGRCHIGKTEYVMECGLAKFNSFIRQVNLKEPGIPGNKVVSVGVYYTNSRQYSSYYSGNKYRNSIPYPLDSLYQNSPSDSITLYYLGNFNQKNFYSDRFDWVIINSNGIKSKTKTYSYSKEINGFTYYDYRTHLEVGYGIKTIRNKEFRDLGIKLDPFIQNIHLSIYENDEDFEAFGGSYDRFWSFKSTALNDSSSISFYGNKFSFFYGQDLLRSYRWDMILAGGLSYQSLKLTQEFSGKTTVQSVGFLGDTPQYTYEKSALCLDLSLRTHYNIRHLTLGVLGGYSLDLGNRKWKINGSQVNSSVRGSAGGAYLNFMVGFWWY